MPDTPIFGLAPRLPPAHIEAERALLGALMANNRAIERVEEFLHPEHFADPVNGRIYAAILARTGVGQLADLITLRAQFEGSGVLDDVGGTGYLAQLLGAMVGVINAGEYGRAIHDAWIRRELIHAGEELVNAAFAATDELPTGHAVLEAHESRLMRIAEGAGDMTPTVAAGEAVAQAVQGAVEASKRSSPLAGITTGYAALDRMTAGLQRGKYILLAARPSMGKTALGLGIAARAAAAGHHVLYWSGEMGPMQLGARMAAAHANISTLSVFTGRGWRTPDGIERLQQPRPLEAWEWDRFVAAERAAHRLKLQFDGRPGVTVAALRARARRLKRAGKLDLLVVDYIGLMRASAAVSRQKLYEQITEISRDLMALKMELDIPLLVMCQMSRANESREDKMPQLHDLRESGALEQDADVVMFIHRPHYYLSRAGVPQRSARETDEAFDTRLARWKTDLEQSEGQALVSLAKNRQGPTGVTRLRFQDETTWFRDESELEDAPAWKFSGE